MYEIYYKNILAFKINNKSGEVVIVNGKYLPFDIYLEESSDIDDRINNITNFNAWASSRVLSLDREYAKEILNCLGFPQAVTDAERAKIAIITKCLSINDCFWLKDEAESVCWEDVNLFDNCLENAIFEISLLGKTPTLTNRELISPDISTDGTAPKAWLRENCGFYLFKGDKKDSVRREVEASQILKLLGFPSIEYVYDEFDGNPVSRCKCYTNEMTNLVRAEWFSIWCMNHDTDISEYIGKFREHFDKMNLADYLIGNSDEHSFNWGFIYDNNMEIVSMNPLMDYDHAFESGDNSPCLPARFLGLSITQKDMAISIIRMHPDWISKNVDLSSFHYGAFVQERINGLLNDTRERA